MCPECGESRSFDGVYCFSCGASIDMNPRASMTSPGTVDPANTDDLPVRPSYLFVSDGLLFSSLWYVPASIIILTALIMVFSLLDASWVRDLLGGGLLVSEIALIAWLLFARREKDFI